ncbi:hypothetical protein ACSBR2_002874 [Camellia fascicularis]
MGRAPCCDKENVKRGPWAPEEDAKLKEYIEKHGTGGNWIALPQKAGLRRCGKSCRLRWLNYLRPNIKHGEFSDNEDRIICTLFASIGSRWSIIAAQLPGRTDNDIKNYWNTKLKKKLMKIGIGIVPSSPNQRRPHHHQPTTYPFISLLHHNSSSSPSPSPSPSSPLSSSSSYKYHNTQTSSFIGYDFEPFSIPSSSTTNSTVLQAQEGYVSPNLLFGGEAASCSSSDGSFNNNNQINHGREMESDYGGHMGLQSYYHLYNGVGENLKYMVSSGVGGGNANNGLFYGGESETPIDCSSVEEIKQLINTNTNIYNNMNFYVDNNKREEKVMYY